MSDLLKMFFKSINKSYLDEKKPFQTDGFKEDTVGSFHT